MMKTLETPKDGLPGNRRAYTIAEAAKLLGVHRVSVYRRLYSGQLKVLKGFGQLMIPAHELDRFLSEVVEYSGRRRKNGREVLR
jgi:excisionase family DNA binding protein